MNYDPSRATPKPVDILILGAGWTSTFLIPLLQKQNISFAATSTTGRDGTISFTFQPDSTDLTPYTSLPEATTILITFPLKGPSQSRTLVHNYTTTHHRSDPHWIQLGSTGIYTAPGWTDHTSPYDTSNQRAIAEDELLATTPYATVLNLAGLYGGSRVPRAWVNRVAKSLPDAKAKGALHLIHGEDVARLVLGVHEKFDAVKGRRWVCTDLRVLDWWWLLCEWDAEIEGVKVKDKVVEWMEEDGVKALPREQANLGRCLDGRGVWSALGLAPARSAKDVIGE